jgi:hypothetical protein
MTETKLTAKQLRLLWGTAKRLGLSNEDVHEHLFAKYGHSSVHQLAPIQFSDFIDYELPALKKTIAGIRVTFAPMTEADLKARVNRF